MKFRYFVSISLAFFIFSSQARATSQNEEVMKPIKNFLVAIASRDKAAILAQVVPHMEIMSARNGALRRLTVEQISDLIASDQRGLLNQVIHDPKIEIDNDLANVWTSYDWMVNGTVDHCGSEVWNLLKLNGSWVIVGVADTASRSC